MLLLESKHMRTGLNPAVWTPKTPLTNLISSPSAELLNGVDQLVATCVSLLFGAGQETCILSELVSSVSVLLLTGTQDETTPAFSPSRTPSKSCNNLTSAHGQHAAASARTQTHTCTSHSSNMWRRAETARSPEMKSTLACRSSYLLSAS